MKGAFIAVLLGGTWLMGTSKAIADEPQDLAAQARGFLGNAAQAGTPQLLNGLNQDNQTLIQLGQLAEKKASSSVIRTYAKTLVTDHLAAAKTIASAAESSNVALANEVPAPAGVLQQIKNLSGGSFDKAFIKNVIESHLKGLASLKAAGQTSAAPLQNLSEGLLPKFQKSLDKARGIAKTLGFSGAPPS